MNENKDFIYQVSIPWPCTKEQLITRLGIDQSVYDKSREEILQYHGHNLSQFHYLYFEPLIKANEVIPNERYNKNAANIAFGIDQLYQEHDDYIFKFKDKELAEDCAKTFKSKVEHTVEYRLKNATARVSAILSQQFEKESDKEYYQIYESEIENVNQIYSLCQSGANGNSEDAIQACKLFLAGKVPGLIST